MKTIRDILARLLPTCRRRTSRWRQPLLAVALGLAAGAASAAPPANDNFASATAISGLTGAITGTNTLATLQACETNRVYAGTQFGNFWDKVTNSVWFAYTPANNGSLSLDAHAANLMGPALAFVLAAWTDTSASPGMCDGTLTNLIAADSNLMDTNLNHHSTVTIPVRAGVTNYIEVCSRDDGSSPNDNAGAYQLSWNFSPLFANNITRISGANGVITGNNASAAWQPCETNQVATSEEPNGDSQTNIVWFVWTAPANGVLELDTAGSAFEAVLSVWTDTNAAPTLCDGTSSLIAADDDGQAGIFSEVNFAVTAGATYYLSLASWNDSSAPFDNAGAYQLNWNLTVPTIASGAFQFTTVSNTVSIHESNSPAAEIYTHQPSLVGARVTITRSGGSSGRVWVPMFTEAVTNYTQTTIVQVSTNAPTTNTVPLVTTNVITAVPLLTNTLVFDDYQMSASYLLRPAQYVPITTPGLPSVTNSIDLNSNSVTTTTYSNTVVNFTQNLGAPYLDPLESYDLLPPTLGAVTSETITVLTQETAGAPGPVALFNYERATFRVDRDKGFASISFWRTQDDDSSGNDQAVTVNCTIGGNLFPLEAGSDYALAGSDYGSASNSFTLPAGVYGGTLIIPLTNNGTVEFDMDVQLGFSFPPQNGTAAAGAGKVATATLTILPDSATPGQQPAGAVDRFWNKDNLDGSDSSPPFLKYPGTKGGVSDTANGNGGTVYAIVEQPDGKTIIAGGFNSYDSNPYNYIARLLTNGYQDTTFLVPPNSGANGTIHAMALQPDGRILIGGDFTAFNGANLDHIARLNRDGSVDPAFNPVGGVNGSVYALALQTNGQVVIAGNFTAVNGVSMASVARLNADGSLDSSFNPAGGPNGTVNAVVVDALGRVLVGGDFDNFAGSEYGGVVRLNVDGSVDTTFSSGIGTYNPETGYTDPVYALAMQGSQILVGGSFSYMELTSYNGLVRLNPDGTLDTTFSPGADYDNGTYNPQTDLVDAIYAITLQPDGNILIGGDFTTYNQTRRVGIARLFSDGSLDTSFMDTAYNQFAGLINHYHNPNAVNPSDYPQGNHRNYVRAIGVEAASSNNVNNVIIGGSFLRVGGGSFYHSSNLGAYGLMPAKSGIFANERMDLHPRSNVARLIGGGTPGPGNITELPPPSGSYSAANNAKTLYVSLARTNGSLGPISASCQPVYEAFGPGIATANDVTGGATPFWPTLYSIPVIGSYSWRSAPGYFGPNFDFYQTYHFNVINNSDVYFNIFNDTNRTGNLNAEISLSAPDGNSFTLGGEKIPLGAALGFQALSPLVIIDSNFKPGTLAFSSSTYTTNEGSTAVITVIRTNGSSGQVQITYNATAGTAINHTDFTATHGTLVFADGVTTPQTFNVPTFYVGSTNSDKTVSLQLASITGGATMGLSNAVLYLVNSSFGPGHVAFSSPTYSVNENAGPAVITVNRVGGSAGTLDVTAIVGAAGTTAINGVNYTASTNLLHWDNSDVSARTIPVPIFDNGYQTTNLIVNLALTNGLANNSPNSLVLSLSAVTNATLTIVNEDFPGVVQFDTASYGVKKFAGQALIPVVRTGGSAGTVSVNFGTQNGTAFSGTNYVGTNNEVLTFTNGQTAQYVSVPVLEDNRVDGLLSLNLILTNASPATALGSLSNAVLGILDTDGSIKKESPGLPDSVFNPLGGFNGAVFSMAFQTNGQLLVAGAFTLANGLPRQRLARLTADGALDAGFLTPTTATGADGQLNAVLVQADGRIVVGGFFQHFNSVVENCLARLNTDGSLDSTFNLGSGANNPVNALTQSPVDQKLLVAGSFTAIGGTTFNGIARLNTDGTPDTGFNAGGLGAGSTSGSITVYAVAVQASGKILIGGDFTSYNGVAVNHLARLNTDGSLDTGFAAAVGTAASGSVRAITVQLDGKIVIGGAFTNFNGGAFNGVARLNADGSVDGSFAPQPGANATVSAIAQQLDGRLLLGGQFTECSGVSRNYITRLNANGTVDPTINFGTGANSFVAAIAVQEATFTGAPANVPVPDEKIILAGGFTQYDSQPHPYLVRLYGGSETGSGAFQFSAAKYQVDENATNAVITVIRTGGTSGTNADGSGSVYVTAFTSDGTALADVDHGVYTNYQHVSANLVFPMGEVVQSFLVPVLNDGLVSPNLTVNLTLTNPTLPAVTGNQPTAVLTILNDNSTVSFASSTYLVAKNVNGGQAPINVVRSGSAAGTTTVNFTTTASGSATPMTDYTPVTQTVTFAPGVSNVVVGIPIINNGIPEGNQTVTMQLANATGSTLVNPTNATLTIIDTVNAPGLLSFTSPAYSVTEGGGAGDSTVLLTVQRTYGTLGTVSVNFQTQDGTATAGLKYVATNGVLTFGDGQNSATFPVEVINTTTAEGPETFSVVLSNPTGGASLTPPSNTAVTILNTNIGIAFASATNAFTEPSGIVPGSLLLSVVRYNNTNGTTTVNYSTTNGTAMANTNFIGVTNGVLTFHPGDAVQTIALTTIHDPRVTGDLFFTVGLALTNGAAQLTSPSFTVVADHDSDAGISFLTNAVSFYRNANYAIILVSNTNPNLEPMAVNFATADGSALAGADYTATNGTLFFTNGLALNSFVVRLLPSNSGLTNRTFTVALSNPTPPGVLLSPATESVTIIGANTPAGLSFYTPISISGSWGSTNLDNTFAVPDAGDPAIAGQAPNAPLWFAWTAPPGGNGEVTVDTIGSVGANGQKLDTVLGVYTGGSLSTLNQVAANDDLYPNYPHTQENEDAQNIFNTNATVSITGYTYQYSPITGFTIIPVYSTNASGTFRGELRSYTQPFGGPSGLRFNATAGTTYYLAVDTKATSTYIISNGFYVPIVGGYGPIQLNWAYHPAGVFRFAAEAVDQTGITDTNGNPMLLYECAETEGQTSRGDEGLHGIVGPVDHNQYKTTYDTYYDYDVDGLLVTVTRVAGASGRVLVDYTTVDGNTNIINNGDTPAVGGMDYTPVSGTLIFDDFEMSKTIVIPILDDYDRNFTYGSGQNINSGAVQPNRDFSVVLSNPRRDPAESLAVSAPHVDPIFGQALCRILDCDTDPNGYSTSLVVSTNINILTGVTNVVTNTITSLIPANPVFNFSKKNYRIPRDVQAWFGGSNSVPVTVYVNRTGTNQAAATVSYRFDSYFLDNGVLANDNYEFPLQPGSDYATPTPATQSGIFGTNSDFACTNGALTFPGGKKNQSQTIQFNVQNNHIPGFNKDIHITLYQLATNGTPYQAGMVAETTVTILFDDSAPPAGSVDELYNPDFAQALALLTNGLALGSILGSDQPNPGADNPVYALAVTTNNEAIIGGAFYYYYDCANGYPAHGLALLDANGQFDTNFNSGVGINVKSGSYVQSLALTPGNQIVIGGNFTSYNNQSANYIARLNANGTLDATFATGTGFNGKVWCVLAQPNGQVLVGGNFTAYAGVPCNYVVRLNPDGSLDPAFTVSNLLTGPVQAMALTAQGGVVIGGQFKVVGQAYANLARLNVDGSLDTSFSPGTGVNGPVLAVVVQPDNKVLLGGSFQSISGVALNHLARLNADGSIDGTYQNGTGTDNTVYSLMLDPATTNLYAGGLFTMMNGTHRLGLARLYPNGTVDTTFLDTAYNQFAGLPRILFNDAPAVFATALQGDGNVLIGGSFQEVGGGQADYNVRAAAEQQHVPPLAASTTNQDLLVSEGGSIAVSYGAGTLVGNLEPKTRDGVRNRSNIARLIGGATPGPGNLGMVSSSYAVDKTQGLESVTLVRTNGSLGYALANFAVLPLLAQSGMDYSYNSLPPLYPIDWEYSGPSREHIDGLFGLNGIFQDSYGELYKYGLNGPASVNVTIINNRAASGNLSATLQMANPSSADLFYLGGQDIPVGVALGASAAPLTVVDNTRQDGVFSFAAASFVASNSPVTLALTRTNGSSGTVQVYYQTVTNGSTAVANVDYTPVNGVVTFASAQTAGSFPVTILNNSSISAQEKTVNVQLYNLQDLSGGNAQLGLSNTVVRLINPNYPGFLNFNTNTYFADLSAGVIKFTVTRTVGSQGTASVQYRTADLTALNGTNYVGATNTLTWNHGDVSPRTISIPLININQTGPVLLFTANLFNPTLNGTNTPGLLGPTTSATCFIINDDTYGTLQFSLPAYQYNDGSNAIATVTVVRGGSALGTASVHYSTLDGTALAGVNYMATNNLLTFAPGQLAQSFNVRLLDDGRTNDPAPANFYFQVSLSNPSAGAYLNPSFTNAVVRLVHEEQYNQPPGSVDESYTAGVNNSVQALALQSDGTVVAGGSFTTADGTSRNRLARFNTDGTLDDTFLDGLAGANATVNALVSQTDDHILVGGGFNQVNGVNNQHLVRLMTDGSLDTSFNPGSAADNPVFALAEAFINGARVIYVGGAFENFEGGASPGIVRLNNSGAVDSSFAVGQGVAGIVYALAVYPTNSVYYAGDVLVGGAFTNFNGASVGNLVRLNPDGSLDPNFSQNVAVGGPVRAIAIQWDGSVLIGGEFTNVNHTAANNLARLTPAGALDTAFTAAAAPGVNGSVGAIALQQDNRIVLGGQFNSANGVTRSDLTRLFTTGAVDPTINFGLGANGAVNAVVIQPTDGDLVIGGGFTQFNGLSCDHIARLFGGSEIGSGAFQFTSASYQVDENGSFAAINIERTGGTSGPNADGSGDVFVAFTTSNGTAAAGANYTYTTNYVDFPAGEVLETVLVPVQNDGQIESNLTVNLSLSNPSPGASLGNQATAVLTIINDNSQVQFAQPNYPLRISANGLATIPVIRVGSTSGSCSVNFATTTNGTAVLGTDYYPTNALITFTPGVMTNSIQVPVLYDTNVSGATVTMMLTNALNTALASPSNAVLSITDNSTNPGVLFFAQTNVGVYSSAGYALLPVSRVNGSAGAASVYYTTVPGTALPGVDYTPVTNQLAFASGDTSESCQIPVINNSLAQKPVSLSVYLFNPSGAGLIAPTNATLTISNNTAVFAFTQATNTVAENQGSATLVVQRFNNSSIVSSVNYATTGFALPGINSAVAGVNYSNTAGTLTFGAGQMFQSISVPLINRSNIMTLAFGVDLSSPTNGRLVAPSNAVVLLEPAAAGVTFTTNATSVLNNAGVVPITVVCLNPAIEPLVVNSNSVPLEVNYTTVDGSARAGYNYNAVSGTLVFTNGLATNTFYVPILNNQFLSSNLTFSVILTNVTAPGMIAPYGTQNVAIVQGSAGMSFSQANYNVFKNSGLATITVNRTGFTGSTASVNYFVTNGSAIGGQNFYPTGGTLRFTNGVTSQSFNVTLIANTLVQPNLFALMGLFNPTNAQIVNPGAATLTILETGASYIIPAGAQLITNSSPTDMANDVVGSNDTVQVLFAFRDAAGLNVTNLIATLLATNGVTAPIPASNSYGPLTVYGHSVSQPFTFTAKGTNALTISPTFQLTADGKSAGVATFVFTLGAWTTTFANTNPIIIYDHAAASPYPSIINVSGLGSSLVKATVTLTNLSHQNMSDVDALVVSPGGSNTLIMSHAGANIKVAHLTLTFDDAASNSLPQNTTLTSGTNKPTQYSPPSSFP